MEWLDKVEGLSESQKSQIINGVNGLNESIAKLESKRDEILSEKRSVVAGLERSQKEFEDYKEKVISDQEQARIDSAKTVEELRQAIKDKDDRLALKDQELIEKTQENQRIVDDQTKSAVRSDWLKEVRSDPASRMYIQNIFDAGTKVVDGKITPIDSEGNPTGKTIDDFKADVFGAKENANYILANVGSGGSASGSSVQSGSAAKIWTRSQFNEASQTQRASFFKEGGKLEN